MKEKKEKRKKAHHQKKPKALNMLLKYCIMILNSGNKARPQSISFNQNQTAIKGTSPITVLQN